MTPVHKNITGAGLAALREKYLRDIEKYKRSTLPTLFLLYMQSRKRWRQLKFRRDARGASAALSAIVELQQRLTDLQKGIQKYRELRRKLVNAPVR